MLGDVCIQEAVGQSLICCQADNCRSNLLQKLLVTVKDKV